VGGAEMRQLWREWQESQDDDAEHDSADSASGDDEGNDTTLPYPRGPRTLQFARASARAPTHTRAHTLAVFRGGGGGGVNRGGGGGGDDEVNDTTLPYPHGPRTLQFARASARAPTHTRAHTLAALSGGVMSDGARGGMESGSRMRLQGHRQGREQGGAVGVLGRARHNDTGERAWRERGEAGGGVKVSDAMVARWVAAGVRKRRV